jgi:hypothetical protein
MSAWSRREIIAGLGTALFVPLAHAEEARPTGAAGKLLQNRTELWANYAKRTKNLMARLTTTRETSLLDEPLVVTGALVFESPRTLVLRDDGLTGSTTFIDPDRVVVAPNQSERSWWRRPPSRWSAGWSGSSSGWGPAPCSRPGSAWTAPCRSGASPSPAG